jgi:hypothetical protein
MSLHVSSAGRPISSGAVIVSQSKMQKKKKLGLYLEERIGRPRHLSSGDFLGGLQISEAMKSSLTEIISHRIQFTAIYDNLHIFTCIYSYLQFTPESPNRNFIFSCTNQNDFYKNLDFLNIHEANNQYLHPYRETHRHTSKYC